MSFETAVKAVPELESKYCRGLQALRQADRERIACSNTRYLAGSIDIDTALQASHQNDPRWDYGIGWKSSGSREEAIWIEVHPASSSHVNSISEKVQWLKRWLPQALLKMTRENEGYVWLASGRVCLQRGSQQARQLALSGVSFPKERLNLQ